MTYIHRAALVRVALLLSGVTILCGTAHAQCDPLRWGNVSGWKGQFSETGNGSGPFALVGPFVGTYTNTQTINGTPVLQGSYPNWAGPSSSIADVNVSINVADPKESFQNSQIGGPPTGGDLFQLSIDQASCKYSLLPQNQISVNSTTTACDLVKNSCVTATVPSTNQWGPLLGPGGPSDFVQGLPANNTSSTGVIALPAVGVDLSYTVPTYTEDSSSPLAATWNANWKFSPSCHVDPSKLIPFSQGDTTWGSDVYDNWDKAHPMRDWACALTSLAMAIHYANPNVVITPGELNTIMRTDTGDFFGHSVDFPVTTDHASGRLLKWDNLGGTKDSGRSDTGPAADVLDNALCSANPHPVIVGVKHCLKNSPRGGPCPQGTSPCVPAFPCHYVLVTGREGDGMYTITDPGYNQSSLSDYNNDYTTRGIVKDPIGDISRLVAVSDNNATITVTDSSNRRTGYDPASGGSFQEIPSSAYYEDQLLDDVTQVEVTDTTHTADIFQPVQGTYQIGVTGLQQGPYIVTIHVIAQDGSDQPEISITGNASPGSTSTTMLNYVSTPGAISSVVSMGFSAFAAKAEIATGSRPGFEVTGAFTLAPGSAGITPDTQPVTLTLGSFATTIPAGSFKRHLSGAYAFEGTINGVALEFRIKPMSGNSFSFKAEADGANLTGATNPISLGLLIGSDGGTTEVTPEFERHDREDEHDKESGEGHK